MGDIGESTGDPPVWSRPVSVMSNVWPSTESLGIELTVRTRIGVTIAGISYRNPENEFSVIGLGERLVDLRGRIAKTFFGFHTGNIKILVVEQIFAGNPTTNILTEFRTLRPRHVIFFQFLCLRRKWKN